MRSAPDMNPGSFVLMHVVWGYLSEVLGSPLASPGDENAHNQNIWMNINFAQPGEGEGYPRGTYSSIKDPGFVRFMRRSDHTEMFIQKY